MKKLLVFFLKNNMNNIWKTADRQIKVSVANKQEAILLSCHDPEDPFRPWQVWIIAI